MDKMYSIQILVCAVAIVYIVSAESFDRYKIVDTTNGKIRGIKGTTLLNGGAFYSFRGIPYAKPPVADLRFKVTNQNVIPIKSKVQKCEIIELK